MKLIDSGVSFGSSISIALRFVAFGVKFLLIIKKGKVVFRYALGEPEKKVERANCQLQMTVSMLGCVMSELSIYLNRDFGFMQQDLLCSNSHKSADNLRCLFDKEIHEPLFDRAFVKKKHMVIARSGHNSDGQESDDRFLPGLPDDTSLDIFAWTSRSDYPNLACLNKKFESLIGSGYLYILRRRLGIIEHWVYLACILMPWEAFDPARQRWMRLPMMPCDECFTYADKESLAVGTELLVFGRELTGFAIWMYSLISRKWSRCPLMNLPRCLFGSSSLGGIAIVAGGSDKHGQVLKYAELYDSDLGAWQTLPDMNVPRKLCSGFFMNGKFYVIGGMSSQINCLTCGDEYDIEKRTWRRIENMYPVSNVGSQPAMRSPPLVAVVNNQLYSADQATNEVKKYDMRHNSWSVVRRLPVRADSSNGWGLAFKACGNRLLVIGGHRGPEGEVIVLHAWEPEDRNGEWNVLSVRERAGAFVYNCAIMGC